MDFLADNNPAGQSILRIVSRGNAIIAELERMSAHVPPVFRLLDRETQVKYAEIICDFSYLQKAELFEQRIENKAETLDLDRDFRENHFDILSRFYNLFESIYKYIKDLTQYLEDLEEGIYIQHTLENVLLNNDGKQLMVESVYLYGVMMLLMDELIDGVVRERLLISYLRYKGKSDEPLLDEVCKLCRFSGYLPKQRKPLNYPEEYLQRIPLPKTSISLILGRLRSDDIYNYVSAYPLPDHRSTALATQASMLYVILFFNPEVLHNQQASMREIVDKHFPDNWVINYYLGFIVDLSVVWEPYRAARAALANTTQAIHVTKLKEKFWKQLDEVMKKLDQYLTAGVLIEDFILDNLGKLMNTLREANVTLRWLMLHVRTEDKKLRPLLLQDANFEKILALLLQTSQFEFILKDMFQNLLNSKQERWEQLRKDCSERMSELGDYFSGEKALTRVKRNERLMNWFKGTLSVQIMGLDYTDFVLAGRKLTQIIQALERVEDFHEIESSLQVKQFLAETRASLTQMLRIVNVKESVLVMMAIISDLSYGWVIIHDYVPSMQATIKENPSSVLNLRATFLKLVSILQMPLVRINQAKSPDLYSVSEYYSGELVQFVRTVLEIVPKTMFETLADIIRIQTAQNNQMQKDRLSELPTKIEKDKLQEWAQLDQRYELARLTHSISVFTKGILAMETTLVGIVKVDPHKLLEDGIRKQLVIQIAGALDKVLLFKTGKAEDFIARIRSLSYILDGVKRSFQYIQESSITMLNKSATVSSRLQFKIINLIYQSIAIPIPKSTVVDGSSVNFIGRLAKELLQFTNGSRTIYIDSNSAWYEKEQGGRELVNIKTFELLIHSVDVFGVSGLDKLYGYMIVRELQKFLQFLSREVKRNREVREAIAQLVPQLAPTTVLPKGIPKLYTVPTAKLQTLWNDFLNVTTVVGQMQLLRRQIAHALNFRCKLDSSVLYSSLHTLNKSLIKDVQQHYRNPETKPYPNEENPLMEEMSDYLENAGISDPLSKIYIALPPVDNFACFVFLFVISQVIKFQYQEHLSILVQKKADKKAYDGTPFVIGVITLLKQFHSSHTLKFLAYMGQYVRAYLNRLLDNKEMKLSDFPEEATSSLLFLEEFFKFSNLDRKLVEGFIPSYIFDYFKH